LKAVVAGKTGTSRDGWFAGYTPNLVCAVWVGFDDGSQLGMTGANSALPIWTDFMQVALAEHPDWQGDWERPAGVEEIEINPKTGQLATAEDTDKRLELFINGTGPNNESGEPDVSPSPESEELPSPGVEIPDASPPALPSPSLKPKSSPTVDSTRLEGTITLDIDPTTGLIAGETCPVVRTKTFTLGTEPKKYCGPEYHSSRSNDPGASRPRTVATPPR